MSNIVTTFAIHYLKTKCIIKADTGCWLWQKNTDRRGYGKVKHRWWGSEALYAHRAAWLAVGNEIPEGMILLHACDTPSCCNPKHLSLGTHKENTLDMLQKNRQFSKISREDAENIRELSKSGSKIKDIAIQYDVTEQTIRNVITGKTWNFEQVK
jgi:hypothetical protein